MKGGRLVGSNGAILQTEGFEGGPPEGLRAAPSPQRDSMVARRTGPGGGRGGVKLGPMEDLRAGLEGPQSCREVSALRSSPGLWMDRV